MRLSPEQTTELRSTLPEDSERQEKRTSGLQAKVRTALHALVAWGAVLGGTAWHASAPPPPALGREPDRSTVVDRVDLTEINHYHDDRGRPVFDQIIYYRFDAKESRYQVIDWRLLKQKDQLPLAHTSADGMPTYIAIWTDFKERDVRRKIFSTLVREIWTDYDPELLEREFLAENKREKLRPRIPSMTAAPRPQTPHPRTAHGTPPPVVEAAPPAPPLKEDRQAHIRESVDVTANEELIFEDHEGMETEEEPVIQNMKEWMESAQIRGMIENIQRLDEGLRSGKLSAVRLPLLQETKRSFQEWQNAISPLPSPVQQAVNGTNWNFKTVARDEMEMSEAFDRERMPIGRVRGDVALSYMRSNINLPFSESDEEVQERIAAVNITITDRTNGMWEVLATLCNEANVAILPRGGYVNFPQSFMLMSRPAGMPRLRYSASQEDGDRTHFRKPWGLRLIGTIVERGEQGEWQYKDLCEEMQHFPPPEDTIFFLEETNEYLRWDRASKRFRGMDPKQKEYLREENCLPLPSQDVFLFMSELNFQKQNQRTH